MYSPSRLELELLGRTCSSPSFYPAHDVAWRWCRRNGAIQPWASVGMSRNAEIEIEREAGREKGRGGGGDPVVSQQSFVHVDAFTVVMRGFEARLCRAQKQNTPRTNAVYSLVLTSLRCVLVMASCKIATKHDDGPSLPGCDCYARTGRGARGIGHMNGNRSGRMLPCSSF